MDAGRGRSRRSPQRRYTLRVVRPWRRTSDEYPRSHARCYSRTMPRAAHPAAIRTASRRNHPQRRQAAAGPQRCSHDRHTDKRSLAILGGRGEGMGAYPPLPPPSPLRLIPPCAPPAWPIREDVAFASLALRCRATSSVRDRARGEGKPHRRPGGSSESRGSHGQGRLMMVSPFRPLPPSLPPIPMLAAPAAFPRLVAYFQAWWPVVLCVCGWSCVPDSGLCCVLPCSTRLW